MKKVKSYWENVTEVEAECFGLECDENGYYDYDIIYSEEEEKEMREAQAREAYNETPDSVLYQLGLK